jgi:hypothetical protein
MKKIWIYLMSVAESFGKARAATTLARMGRYDEARNLMSGDKC